MKLLLLLLSGAGALSSSRIRIGTRSSPLALVQAKKVASTITHSFSTAGSAPQIELVQIDAPGDRPGERASTQDVPLAMRGVDFTGTLDDALLEGRIDAAVHSLKDVPPANRWRAGLTIGCYFGPRADPSDVLVGPYGSLDSLPKGARVGSASVRRQAQLLALRPDVQVVNVRGNVRARIAALESGHVDAVILAAAGLQRLGLLKSDGEPGTSLQCHPIPLEIMLPGVAQGIVAAACRSDDDAILNLLRRADDRDARIAAATELSLLKVVDGSAPWQGRPPVAALMMRKSCAVSRLHHDERNGKGWVLRALLATPDGKKVIRSERELSSDCCEEEACTLGEEAGEELLKLAGPGFYVA